MKIGLVDVDSHNFPNISLMKVSSYWRSQGASTEWAFPMEHYDRVYISKTFSFTPDDCAAWQADEIIRAGSGYAIELVDGKEVYHPERDEHLPDNIELMRPDYSLYPQYSEAYGHCTRGCPRGCPF